MLLRKDQPPTARPTPAYLHLVPHRPAMHTRISLSRVQFAIHRSASSVQRRIIWMGWSNYVSGKMQSLRDRSVCPYDMHVFSAFQPCIETWAIDVVSYYASAQETVLEYKGLHGRFYTLVLCFVSFLVFLRSVGKRKSFLLCILLSCAVPLFTASTLLVLSRSFGYHWRSCIQTRHWSPSQA